MSPKTGPGRPTIGALTSVRLTDELRTDIATYAEAHNLKGGQAIRVLLQAGLDAAAKDDSIWGLFPELDPATTTEAELAKCVELAVRNEPDLPGTDCGEYDWDGVFFCHGVTKIRGRWIYYRDTELTETDDQGRPRWGHEYILTATRREAEDYYRATLLDRTRAWDPDSGQAMWAECGYRGDIAHQLIEDGTLPAAAFDDDLAADLADQRADETAETTPAEAIIEAYHHVMTVTGRHHQTHTFHHWIPLAELRAELPQFSRTDIDIALVELFDRREIGLMVEENQKTLRPEDREAALWLGGGYKHFLTIK